MKLITRETDYAIRALLLMSRDPAACVSVKDLVRHLHIPRPFLRRILQSLSKHGILVSQKGKGGGFLMNRPVRRILLFDVMKIFQGEFSIVECMVKRSPCVRKKTCRLRGKLKRIEKHLSGQLRQITLESLVCASNE